MGLFSLKRGDWEGTLQQSLTASKTVIKRKEKNLLTTLVVDRAGSNRLKLQQQGFRLDRSMIIQFSSPALSLGSFKFTDVDIQPTLTEKAVTIDSCFMLLFSCAHPYPWNVPISVPVLQPCIWECVSESWSFSLSKHLWVLLHEEVRIFLILSLFAPADCCLMHMVCLWSTEKWTADAVSSGLWEGDCHNRPCWLCVLVCCQVTEEWERGRI